MQSFLSTIHDDAWLSVLWNTGEKGLALLVLFLRGRSAATRHLVWTLALAGLLLLPALSLLLPRPQFAVLPAEVVVRAPAEPVRAVAAESVARPAAMTRAPRVAAPAVHVHEAAPWTLAGLLRLAWMLGALLAFLPLPFGMLFLHRATRRARHIEGPLVEDAVAALGLHGRVRVLMTDAFAMPLATGIVRPTILVPAEMEAWPEEKRRAVLLHELAHVRRRDCLTHALGRAAVALHWWNPLACGRAGEATQ